MIKDYHHCDPNTSVFPFANLTVTDIEDGKLDDKYVISSRIRCGRSIAGFPFSPTCRRGQRRQVEAILKKALEGLTGPVAGNYIKVNASLRLL